MTSTTGPVLTRRGLRAGGAGSEAEVGREKEMETEEGMEEEMEESRMLW